MALAPRPKPGPAGNASGRVRHPPIRASVGHALVQYDKGPLVVIAVADKT